MLRITNDLREIPEQTMRLLLGKKAYVFDVAKEKLFYSEKMYSFSLNDYSDNLTVNIYFSQKYVNYTMENIVTIKIGKGKTKSRTVASRNIYDKNHNPLSTNILYKDWIIPPTKKLLEIIEITL